MIRDRTAWTGLVTVTTVNHRRGHRSTETFSNLITDAGGDLLVSGLAGVDTELKYLAWGDGAAVPAVEDVALGNELGRKAVTQQQPGAGDGSYVTTTYLAPFDANVQLEELGWFAGAAAAEGSGSGVLVARVLYSRLKTNEESIQVDRTDTLARGA